MRVIRINGVEVHSDKASPMVCGSRVDFADGSWCDVATETIVNYGPGQISIGNAVGGTSSDLVTKGPQWYQASGLTLDRVAAKVTVETHRGVGMEVVITGPQDGVETIGIDVQDGTLIISGGLSERSGMTISSFGGSTYGRGPRNIVSNGDLFVGSTGGVTVIEGGTATQVTVKVPAGTPISASTGDGDVAIGDINGSLTACVFGSGDIKAGRMTAVNLESRGSGEIRVAEVNGSAVVVIRDSGDVTIKSGMIGILTATIKRAGSGDLKVRGVAQRASLFAKGTGDILVERVVEPPDKRATGTGDIRVRKVG